MTSRRSLMKQPCPAPHDATNPLTTAPTGGGGPPQLAQSFASTSAAAASAAAPPFLVCFLAAAFLAAAARALVASLAASTREGRREHSRGRPPPLGPLAGVEGAGATTHVWKEPGARLAASTQPPGPTGTDCHASGSRSSVTHTRPWEGREAGSGEGKKKVRPSGGVELDEKRGAKNALQK